MTAAAPARESAPSRNEACAACGSEQVDVFHRQSGTPVHSCRLVATREEALAFPRGELALAFCAACGFIGNSAYDASLQDYGLAYEETQGFSPTFQAFMRELALRWIDRHDLRGKTLLEIGCGKGEFLALICELGGNTGVGIDPAFVPERLDSAAALTFIADLYSPQYAHLTADAVLCRHTLEHIAPVGEFMSLVRDTIAGRDSIVLFELPDVTRVLRETAFWDIYYEHCSYFSPGSLARLFRRSGFDVVGLERDYDDQYVLIEARPAGVDAPRPALEEPVEELAALTARFARDVESVTARWRDRLAADRAAGRRVALWGAGSKAVSFLTTVGGADVDYAVDINPYKRSKFIAGTGHPVLGPDDLAERPPDVVIAMNDIYLGEIRERLDALRLGATTLLAA
jgi:SAM-dependent methyltransferase